MRADLVGEHGPIALDEHDRTVLRYGELCILEHQPHEVALDLWLQPRPTHDLAPEVAEAPVRDDGEVRKERLLLDRVLVLARRARAEDAPAEGALDELGDGGLDDLDAGRGEGLGAEGLDEAAVVEGAALVAVGVGDVHGLAVEHDAVAVGRDGVDAVDAGLEAELFEGHDAARLEELADDAVGLSEGAFEEAYAEGPFAGLGGGGEGVGEGGACDAGADDEDVVGGGPHAVS